MTYQIDVSDTDTVDLYEICHRADVMDPSGCRHHALKKILFAGKRGAKSRRQDIEEARDTLNRWLEIYT